MRRRAVIFATVVDRGWQTALRMGTALAGRAVRRITSPICYEQQTAGELVVTQ
jgi:hypothetical protein